MTVQLTKNLVIYYQRPLCFLNPEKPSQTVCTRVYRIKALSSGMQTTFARILWMDFAVM